MHPPPDDFPTRGLKPKQAAFVRLFVAGPDHLRGVASHCYLAAGYKASTRHSAEAAAHKLLNRPAIKQAIAAFHWAADAALKADAQQR